MNKPTIYPEYEKIVMKPSPIQENSIFPFSSRYDSIKLFTNVRKMHNNGKYYLIKYQLGGYLTSSSAEQHFIQRLHDDCRMIQQQHQITTEEDSLLSPGNPGYFDTLDPNQED